MADIDWPAEIGAARDRIAGRVRRTPVVTTEAEAFGLDHPVVLKREHLQATGSFKVRGAFNGMLSQKVPPAGVVAASGGNFGAAVAFAATGLGHRSTIYVPASIADPTKTDRMRRFGAEVIVPEGSVAETMELFQAKARETGALALHPYDGVATVAGQGTLGAEIEEEAQIDTLFVSVGGGGLIGGIAAWFQGRVRVVAVETETTATLAESLSAGERITLAPSGVAASSLGGPNIGEVPWSVLTRHLAGNVVVTDAETVEAARRLWEDARIVAEPGAAVALAPLTSGRYRPAPDERVGVLVCGANARPGWWDA